MEGWWSPYSQGSGRSPEGWWSPYSQGVDTMLIQRFSFLEEVSNDDYLMSLPNREVDLWTDEPNSRGDTHKVIFLEYIHRVARECWSTNFPTKVGTQRTTKRDGTFIDRNVRLVPAHCTHMLH